jgi:hypothetical protein
MDIGKVSIGLAPLAAFGWLAGYAGPRQKFVSNFFRCLRHEPDSTPQRALRRFRASMAERFRA